MILALLLFSSLAVLGLFTRTFIVLRRYADWTPSPHLLDNAPTVSVCIAARNETHALAQCLERVLKSDYKKIEILVLDDSSADDTSLIIKSFASAGVRFIAGKQLPVGWLGKNHAYQTLTDEASGEYLLFIDVDTHISPNTIANLVSKVTASNISMISVLPRRDDGYRTSAVLGTMRYYWELLLGSINSPPAASALWMVRAKALSEKGIGLQEYGLSVRPERHMARQFQRTAGYKYVIGTASMGVTYEKLMNSQYETAIRLYYPITGRNWGMWLLATIYLYLLVLPLCLLFIVPNDSIYSIWSLILIVFVAAAFGMFVYRTYGKNTAFLRIVLGPALVVQELILLLISYLRYSRNAVTWKGRLVSAQPSRSEDLRIDE